MNNLVLPFSLNIPEEIPVTKIENASTQANNVHLQALRLDVLHPFVSGNKIYKLYYFLEEALKNEKKNIITFGGAYSNHLAATAFACNSLNLKSYGIVRGEEPETLSPTLLLCQQFGMELKFVSRENYREYDSNEFRKRFKENYILVPEGGYGQEGANGAALIMKNENLQHSSHIITAVGTATTLAGLCAGAADNQEIIGMPVLKNMTDIPARLNQLLNGKEYHQPEIFSEYHFGGYAKKNIELLNFMNKLFMDHNLPTDFVYTAKMMYGIFDKIENKYFPPGSVITALHTGGMQGNNSLPTGSLCF